MSSSKRYNYEVHKSQQKELLESRVRSDVQKRYDHFLSVMRDMEVKKFDQMMPKEFLKVRENLSHMGSLLSTDPFGAREIARSIAGDLSVIRQKGSKASLSQVRGYSEKEFALNSLKVQFNELQKEAMESVAKYQEDAPFIKCILKLQQSFESLSEEAIQAFLEEIRAQLDDYIVIQESKKEATRFIQETLQSMDFEVGDLEAVDLDGQKATRLIAKNPTGEKVDFVEAFQESHDTHLKELECASADLEKAYSFKFSDLKKVA